MVIGMDAAKNTTQDAPSSSLVNSVKLGQLHAEQFGSTFLSRAFT